MRASDPTQFQYDLCSIDWAKNGEFLVVGDRNGYIHLIDAETLQILDKAKGNFGDKFNAWIEDVKISPCCLYAAFGTHGGVSKINLVSISPDGKSFIKNDVIDSKVSSAVTHLDWSFDS